jgi:gas vesicle protein
MARNGKFVVGAVLGALFGLAFAPKKGSELRKELKEEIDKGGHGEKTAKKNAAIMGRDIAETAQETYQNPAVQKQLEKGKKEALKLVDQAKDKLQESSEEWVKMAREKIVEGEKKVEKEYAKAFDTLKKKVAPAPAPAKAAAPAKAPAKKAASHKAKAKKSKK